MERRQVMPNLSGQNQTFPFFGCDVVWYCVAVVAFAVVVLRGFRALYLDRSGAFSSSPSAADCGASLLLSGRPAFPRLFSLCRSGLVFGRLMPIGFIVLRFIGFLGRRRNFMRVLCRKLSVQCVFGVMRTTVRACSTSPGRIDAQHIYHSRNKHIRSKADQRGWFCVMRKTPQAALPVGRLL